MTRSCLLLALLVGGCDIGLTEQKKGRDVQIIADTKVLRAALEIQKLETEVAQYRALKGAWPESWRDLRRGQGLDPWGEPYVLEVDGERPVIFSSGEDREIGTGDDVYTTE